MSEIQKKLIVAIFIVWTVILSSSFISSLSQSVEVNVIETRTFEIDFVGVDQQASFFKESNVPQSIEFLNSTYPLSDNNLIARVNPSILDSLASPTLTVDDLYPLSKRIYKKGQLSGSTDRVVGIVPQGWFNSHGLPGQGVAPLKKPLIGTLRFSSQAVIIEAGFRHAAAHELGHTLGLCDEYDDEEWVKLNTTFGGCPNGDLDNDGSLDDVCEVYPGGCPTSTLGGLVPWSGSSESIDLYNFMGSSDSSDLRWIDYQSYSRLLDVFSSPLSFLTVDSGILLSGTIDKEGNVYIDDYSYVLEETSIVNESGSGNFSLIVGGTEGELFQMNFQPQFFVAFIGGNVTEVNISAFAFVVPFSENVTNITIKENSVTKDEIIRTPNTPVINITTNLSGEIFYDEEFEFSWDASDADNDTVAYAVLFSDDDGLNYTTLEIDYNQTNLTLNSSQLPSCEFCRIKVLATDGINTNYSVSDPFSSNFILDVNSLSELYSNGTQRTFGFFIQNMHPNNSIQNITWQLNAGESIINSLLNSTLISSQSKYVIAEYNYSIPGNYTVTATASNEEFSDFNQIQITV